MNYSLKKRKPIVYISLGIYVSLVALILIESGIPGGLSNKQSNIFASIGAWIVNVFNPPRVPSSISPTSFGEVTDTSYLGKDTDGNSNIAIGTTSLITIPVKYPKKDQVDVYNYEYTLSYPLGNKDDYSVSLSTSTNKQTYNIYLRVTTTSISSSNYGIDIKVGDTLTYNYRFKIVELAEPTNYECRISKTNLKIGETSKITTKLLDEKAPDTKLRRYLDERKIPRDSSNNEIATIDELGVVHAIQEGEVTITYGKYTYDIVVSNEVITKPASNSINLEVADSSKANPSLLDYDYVFENNEEPNDYSTLIKASFTDRTLEDKSVSFIGDGSLKVMLAPHHYDEEGFPVYTDENGDQYVRVCGYRKKGEVTIRCVSNADNNIYKDITLNVDEAIPTEMTVKYGNSNKSYVNEQITITAEFAPKNVNNRKIHIDVLNNQEDIVSISNNDSTSVTLTGQSVGTISIRVSSVLNPTLVKDISLEFTARQAIDDDNFDDFAGFMRKAAGHFFLFLGTAVFGMVFFYFYLDDIKKWWLELSITLALGFAVAGFSELIQKFTDGRTGAWSDVGIDFSGYFIGTALTIGVILLIRLIKSKRKPKEIDE